jgi:hydroxymethylbilane synthase
MTEKIIRIGTRDSQLAVWQATLVQDLLREINVETELVLIKSDGDLDLVTPLYEMGVQGVFTKTLDAALLNNRIDIAVHSMKDVPTRMASGIVAAAVLERGNYLDLLVPKNGIDFLDDPLAIAVIATSSTRRKAQWLHRHPNHEITSLRGNVNTRLRKLSEQAWQGAIFAAAGLERIGLRPENAIDLHWMLPAPAQGAILIVCKEEDDYTKEVCQKLNHEDTALCTSIEKDFLRILMGGCSTPISALAEIKNGITLFRGNLFSLDGKQHFSIEMEADNKADASALGIRAGKQLLEQGAGEIIDQIKGYGS